LPGLLGFHVDGSGLANELTGLVRDLDQTDLQSFLLGGGTLAFMLAARWIEPRIPAALIAVVATIATVRLFDLSVETVGPIPGGLPDFGIPNPNSSDYGRLALTAIALALLAFADTSVLSRSYAARFGTEDEQDQELRALGAANLVTGFFQGFPISSSSSRTYRRLHAPMSTGARRVRMQSIRRSCFRCAMGSRGSWVIWSPSAKLSPRWPTPTGRR